MHLVTLKENSKGKNSRMQNKKHASFNNEMSFSFTITKNVHAYKQTKRNAPRSTVQI